MEIMNFDKADLKESYLWQLLEDKTATDNDTLSVTIADLRKFATECVAENLYRIRPYYITIKEAARYLNIQPQRVIQRIKAGDIRAKKLGGKWLVREIDITDFFMN